jgi:hypothetical protein
MEEVLRLKEEELAKYIKIKDHLSAQLKQTKEELEALKVQHQQVSAQLKEKEEMLAKDLKVKDLFASQAKTAREENYKLKEELKEIKEKLADIPKPIYPELEKKIKTLENENGELKQELLRWRTKTRGDNLAAGKSAETADAQTGNASVSVSGELEKSIQQLKTGMFNLAQQNATMDQKFDALMSLVQKIGESLGPGLASSSYSSPAFASKPFSGGSVEKKSPPIEVPTSYDAVSDVSQSDSEGGESQPPLSQKESKFLKPSERLKMQQEAEAAEKAAQESAEGKKEPEEHIRKPSDRLKAPEVVPPSSPGKTPDPGKESSDDRIKKPSDRSRPPDDAKAACPDKTKTEDAGKPEISVPGGKQVKTVPFPKDEKIVCPTCNSKLWQEMENRAKIISFVPVKKYGKKYYCKKCGEEWDYKI